MACFIAIINNSTLKCNQTRPLFIRTNGNEDVAIVARFFYVLHKYASSKWSVYSTLCQPVQIWCDMNLFLSHIFLEPSSMIQCFSGEINLDWQTFGHNLAFRVRPFPTHRRALLLDRPPLLLLDALAAALADPQRHLAQQRLRQRRHGVCQLAPGRLPQQGLRERRDGVGQLGAVAREPVGHTRAPVLELPMAQQAARVHRLWGRKEFSQDVRSDLQYTLHRILWSKITHKRFYVLWKMTTRSTNFPRLHQSINKRQNKDKPINLRTESNKMDKLFNNPLSRG